MKTKNLLIITVASIVMFGCSGGSWPKEQMDLCISQGSIDFGGEVAECICSELEKTYPNYDEVEAMFRIAAHQLVDQFLHHRALFEFLR